MDAVKFIEEHRRMYKVTGKHLPTLAEGIPAEDVVKEVEEWSAAHPRKTRQSVFLEQYPEALVLDGGTLSVCPVLFSSEYRNAYGGCASPYGSCAECRREFWMQEVE
jgi:hypothetical protein|nr:MAG: hypothetical protein [Bacteriophage sp.]DAL81500.1 MAG TPA: hypothetical protein [Caudoviricetes sp.]